MRQDHKALKNTFFLSLLAAIIVCLYGALAAMNACTPMLPCVAGEIDVGSNPPSMSLLAGEWISYPGAPELHTLSSLEEESVSVMHMGVMEGRTYLIRLQGEALSDLYFMLPRSRGSHVFIDSHEVLSANGSISSQDVFAFADYLNPTKDLHEFVLRIPVSGYYYNGYQGVVVGFRQQLERIDQIRYFLEVMCLGLYVTLGLVCLVLFLQKTSERYILSLVFLTLVTAYRFMNFSEYFSSYAVFGFRSEFYRLFFFMRYILCRAFVLPGKPAKKRIMDWAIVCMLVCEVIFYLFIPDQFASICANINLISLAFEGILIGKGLIESKQGVRILSAGWGIYVGMEVFYRLLHIGVIPQGIVDVWIRPTQYAHVAYLIAFSGAVFGKFATKFSEAEEMAVSLEQKVLEQTQELREKSQRIIEEQNQRQQFITDIVHNLRNPLFALGGYLELLEIQMPAATDEQKKYLGLIDDKLAYLSRMVDDMLLVNRLENGKIKFHYIRFDFAAFLNDVIGGNKLLEHCKQVNISCPSLCLEADSFRLHQAIDNLLDNAVIHGRASEIEVSVSQEEGMLHLAIRDNGCGMTQAQINHAFDRYFTSGAKNSAGLGLSITAAIIREHGGSITLSSQVKEGTTVVIVLPIRC